MARLLQDRDQNFRLVALVPHVPCLSRSTATLAFLLRLQKIRNSFLWQRNLVFAMETCYFGNLNLFWVKEWVQPVSQRCRVTPCFLFKNC